MNSSFKLYRLQQIDSQIDRVQNRLAEIERVLNEDAALRAAERHAQQAETALLAERKNLRRMEEDVRQQRIKIEQTESTLYSGKVRNPKELQDLQNESAALKRYLNVLEDRQLEAMIAVEEAEEVQRAALERLEGIQTETSRKNQELVSERERLQSDGSRLQAERQAAIQSIPQKDLDLYDTLRRQRRGIAVARVVDNGCSACGSTLNAALLHAARSPNQIRAAMLAVGFYTAVDMFRFLRTFELDRFSFWLGFFAATLLWWLVSRLRPAVKQTWRSLKDRSAEAREGILAGTEVRLRNDLLKHAQSLHLAAPLFALDEVLIRPRLLAPPPSALSGLYPSLDITEYALPYMPDWPELASVYQAPTLNITEALHGGAHLIITGEPGTGKTVCLAHLASLLLDPAFSDEHLTGRIPLLVHVADLPQALPTEEVEPLPSLVQALSAYTSPLTQARLGSFLETAFSQGQVVLLVDGLDEAPGGQVAATVDFLKALLGRYPQTQAVVAAAPGNFGGLLRLGFMPLTVLPWTEGQRRAFIHKWGRMWRRHIRRAAGEQVGVPEIESTILNGWLLGDHFPSTPFELTLKVWATYAGDLLGPEPTESIEAYLRRMELDLDGVRPRLQILAEKMVGQALPFPTKAEVENWFAGTSQAMQVTNEQTQEAAGAEATEGGPEPLPERVLPHAGPGGLSELEERGLLVARRDGRLGFSHTILTGYLASTCLGEAVDDLLDGRTWTGSQLAVQYRAALSPTAVQVNGDSSDKDPLLRKTFTAARWMRVTQDGASWKRDLLRKLAGILQDGTQSASLRARAMAALAASQNEGVAVLFRQSLAHQDPVLRQLCALGAGAVRDQKAIPALSELLQDNLPDVQRAASLALVSIGTEPALEAVAAVLLNGSEEARRIAAEALANHPEEGHPTLVEACQVEDVMVRRAAVAGLGRIRQPWAVEKLQELQVEDSQWVVQNAASQALDEMNQPDPHIPQPVPDLVESSWLIAFAGEKGIGVVPGKPAYELVLRALNEGTPEQQLAALQTLHQYGDAQAIASIYQAYAHGESDVRSAAFLALEQLAATGVELPPVEQSLLTQ